MGPYDTWLPKSAYINALDFESPKELTEYLLNLAQNETAYNSFFKWKKFIKLTFNDIRTLCDICVKLHLETYFGVKQNVFRNLKDFWNKEKNCLNPIKNNGTLKFVPYE